MRHNNEVWVWIEQQDNEIAPVSIELIGKSLELSNKIGGEVAVVLIGEEVEDLADKLIAYGATKVYLIEDSKLQLYQSEAYAKVIAKLIRQYEPEILLFGATTIGVDLAARAAAKVRSGLTAHCIDLDIEQIDGKPQLVQVVPGFGGRFMIKIICPHKRPQIATVKPGVMERPNRSDDRQWN